MSTLKVSLLQQPLAWLDAEANLRHFAFLLKNIRQSDLIILPEMFTSGFSMEASLNPMPQQQIADWLCNYASKTDAMIGGSVAIKSEKGPVNRFLLVQPDGYVHRYDKRHLFRMLGEHNHFHAGEQRRIVEWRGWRILPQICYDLRFPVFSRNQHDYDLAIYVANWPAQRILHWHTLLLARAIENQAYVAGCNRVGSDGNLHQFSGDSQVISPRGKILAAAAPYQSACLEAELSLDALREYRKNFPVWRDADNFSL